MHRSGSCASLSLVSLLVAPLLVALTACDPSCERTCNKLLSCEGVETPRVSTEDCRLQCERQEQLYDTWDDQELKDAFREHKQCIVAEECSAIAGGTCTDELLTSW